MKRVRKAPLDPELADFVAGAAPSEIAGAPSPPPRHTELPPPKELPVVHDPVSEAVLIAEMARSAQVRKVVVRRLPADALMVRDYADAFAAMRILEMRGLEYHPSTVEKIAGAGVVKVIEMLLENTPPLQDVGWHMQNVLWDRTRIAAVRGPVSAFLDALRDPSSDPSRVRALSRAVGECFDKSAVGKDHIHDPDELVRNQMREIEARAAGIATYPTGIDGLDWYDKPDEHGRRRKRLVPGLAPGMLTLLTAISGSGKTTMLANIVLQQHRLGRRVLWGAFEVNGGMNLELLATISLGWSRAEMLEGMNLSQERLVIFQQRMHALTELIQFTKNPFRTRSQREKATNERNLDLWGQIIADSGCDLWVADLWARILVGKESRPEDEQEALYKQQSMTEEDRTHGILVHQQRLKDIEARPDRRPTREGMKGSGAYVEVPENIIAMHLPSLHKNVPDDHIEAFILKQRWGRWPLGVRFGWDGERGLVSGGESIPYDRPGQLSETDDYVSGADSAMNRFMSGGNGGPRRRKS